MNLQLLPDGAQHISHVVRHTIRISLVFCVIGTTSGAETDESQPDPALKKRVEELIEQLGHRQFAERERAGKELVEIGHSALVPLRKASSNSDPDIAGRAKKCISLIELKIKLTGLVTGLQDADPEMRLRSARGLLELAPPAYLAVPELVRALDNVKSAVKLRVIFALSVFGSDAAPAVTKLIGVLADKQADEELRWCAAMCLGRIGPGAEQAVPLLLRILETEGLRLRGEATRALGCIGGKDERVVAALVKALDDAESEIHFAVALALGQIRKRPELSVPALVKMLKQNIGRLDDPTLKTLCKPSEQRRAAVESLRAFGAMAEPAVALLIEVANNEDERPQTRALAIETLGLVGPKAKVAIPILERLLKNPRAGLKRELDAALLAITRSEE